MYGTPIIYPVSSVPDHYRLLVLANPMSPVVEAFRYAFLGPGNLKPGSGTGMGIYPGALLASFVSMILVLIVGLVLFTRVERTFMDTV